MIKKFICVLLINILFTDIQACWRPKKNFDFDVNPTPRIGFHPVYDNNLHVPRISLFPSTLQQSFFLGTILGSAVTAYAILSPYIFSWNGQNPECK